MYACTQTHTCKCVYTYTYHVKKPRCKDYHTEILCTGQEKNELLILSASLSNFEALQGCGLSLEGRVYINLMSKYGKPRIMVKQKPKTKQKASISKNLIKGPMGPSL